MSQYTNNFLLESFDEEISRYLSKEIIRRCAEYNVTISVDFATLVMQLFSLHPIDGIPFNRKINKSVIEKFLNKCLEKLLDRDSASLKTIEMQAIFINSSLDLKNTSTKYNDRINVTTETLLKEIIEFKAITKDDQDKCLKKIAIDIILSNKLGRPGNLKVVSETINALKSVMSRTDLINFLNLRKNRRLETLRNIRQIVCGIRLFNKDAGHCGEGIPDIISDITEAYNNTKSILNNTYEMLLKRNEFLQKALFRTFSENDDLSTIVCNCELLTEDEIDFLKDIVIMNSQHEHYVKYLLDFMDQIERKIDNKIDDFKNILKNIHDTVQFRVAIATEKVFPQFIKLSNVWHSLLNFLYVMVEINQMNEKFLQITELEGNYACIVDKIIESNENDVCSSHPTEESDTNSHHSMSFDCGSRCKIKTYNNIETIRTFSKFCAYLFTFGNGILIPSNMNLGIIQYNDKHFSFYKEKYAKWFVSDIEKNVEKYFNTVRHRPSAIIFFDLFDEIKNNIKFKTTILTHNLEKSLNEMKLDQETQTEIHPIPCNKDKNYSWNVWELRRRAIKLADIKKCRTHSAQTDFSYYRFNCGSQADLPNTNNETQTNVDDSTCISEIDKFKYFNDKL